jgi:hypothetical protein
MPDTHASAPDTHSRALAINLDGTTYGSFAEIGGGQEVARWFLTVGAASGTVAQTISAYDKAVSDSTYGAGTRYVSRERLLAMLDHEYRMVIDRLAQTRGAQSRLFAFANTVATRNFKGDNEQHGWVGLRFQAELGGEPNDLLLHVNLKDHSALRQQQALGILGVNLVYSIYHACTSAGQFLESLWNELSHHRMEIDVLDFSGPAFQQHDPRAWCIQLLRRKMAEAIAFDTAFHVVEPSSMLRKRPLLVDRGRFAQLDPFHVAMLAAGQEAIRNEGVTLSRDPLNLLEMTLHPAIADDAPDDQAVLARVKNMLTLAPALVSDLPEAYRLVPYLRRYTAEPIRILGGVSMLAYILAAQFYNELPGSLLEGLGKLLASNVTIYVFPMPREAVVQLLGPAASAGKVRIPEGMPLIGCDDLVLAPPLNHLYRYLREAGQVVPIAPVHS